jgi:sulfur-carrier protein
VDQSDESGSLRRRLSSAKKKAVNLVLLPLFGSVECKNPEKVEDCAYEKSQTRESGLMQVVFKIPGALRELTGNQSAVCVEVEAGANLLEVLQALFLVYPGLRARVLTETGETRRHVNIFVGNENVRYPGGLATLFLPGQKFRSCQRLPVAKNTVCTLG